MDGVLLVDKPPGKTSHDVVAAVRRSLGGRKGPKVGHAGTLDPFATGLLLVLVGRATRAQRFFMDLPKTYEAVARFGAVSTTGDPEGDLTEQGRPEVPEPLVLPLGEITQVPPAYSAIKIGGRRAYALARAGEEVVVPERQVTIHACAETFRDGPRLGLRVECSSGTYIRTLVADLGDAYCEELRRTAIGPFSVADAGPGVDQAPLGLADALGRVLPVVALDADAGRRAGHGQAVDGDAEGTVLLVDDGGPVAIAEPRPGPDRAQLKPIVGFRSG